LTSEGRPNRKKTVALLFFFSLVTTNPLSLHGTSLRTIARQLGVCVGLGTIHRALPARSKTVSEATVAGNATFARPVDDAIEAVAGFSRPRGMDCGTLAGNGSTTSAERP
jgi:hypothetical protein